ncbi:MAG TPA: CotH kinase family protein, partial [Tepidisphaeraceae bacterium]|nr:CotH kinase family protein [Tepidisphaeraceae bacterium]
MKQFDKDGDGLLNKEERQAARESIKKERESMQGQRGFGFRGGPGGPGGFGPTTRPAGGPTTRPGGPGMGMQRGGMFGPPPGFGGPGGNREPGKPGPKVSPEQVKSYSNAPFYEPTVLRTLFLEFADADWEAEMVDFYHTDVAVPATLMVDGKKDPNVGVNFRGNTSFMMAGTGSKRSLKLSLDYADSKQQLGGYKSIELLNSAEDPTFLHTILYLEISRHYIAVPKANLVKVVINGESWGIYVNTQPFDKQFAKESFGSKKGDRWKVPVNFRGDSGLAYIGDDIEQYKRRYEMKSDGDEKAWKALVALCRTLKETPVEQLEEALKPMLDVDGALWYLAIDNTLINNDGFWTRASDYGLF